MKLNRNRLSSSCNNRDGAIFVVLILLLPIVVLFVGFSVDIAHIQRIRAELRSSTDLAAKSGAIALSLTQDENAARLEAIAIAAANSVGGQPLTLDPSQLDFGYSVRQSNGKYNYTSGGSQYNAVRVHGKRTADSPDGAVNSFFGFFYGHPTYQPQFESTAAFIDVDICLVLDRSGSMTWPVVETDPPNDETLPPQPNSRWVALDQAVRQFLAIMDNSTAREKVGLATFSDAAQIDQLLEFDYSPIHSDLNNYLMGNVVGSTNIKDGTANGRSVLTSASSRTHAEKIMIIFTDGQFNTGGDPISEATAAAADNITIHTITFSDGADQTTMQQMATIGGGNHYHADDAADLDEIFRQLAAAVSALVD